jgi:hypothetical protein
LITGYIRPSTVSSLVKSIVYGLTKIFMFYILNYRKIFDDVSTGTFRLTACRRETGGVLLGGSAR